MSIYIPVVRKVAENDGVYIERALPTDGITRGEVGMEVKPFDHIGECTVSHGLVEFPERFKAKETKVDNKFYYSGAVLGKVSSKDITAPFNGYLFKSADTGLYRFREVEGRHTLLAGVWGKVEKVKNNKSVFIKTRMLDINLVAATQGSYAGEFVVFPNPSDTLKKHYLSGFSPSAAGRVVYVGDYASLDLVMEAHKLGVGCLLAGSTNKATMNYAKSMGMCLGLLSGFGTIATPKETYDLLSNVANRFVFFQGERHLLRIPVSPEEGEKRTSNRKKAVLKAVKKGMKVMVLEKPHFGEVGNVYKVDSKDECSIFVKFPESETDGEPVKVKLPNILALE